MASQGDENLEDKLRQMILGNVRIGQNPDDGRSDGSRNGPGSHRGSPNNRSGGQRGRGRGFRGGYHGPDHAQGPPYGPGPVMNGDRHQNIAHPQLQWNRGRGGRGSHASSNGHAAHYGHQAQSIGRGPVPQNAQIWSPQGTSAPSRQQFDPRVQYLEQVAETEISRIQMPASEIASKDEFRSKLNMLFTTVQAETDVQLALQSFGSLKSGFATAGSDMDLVIVDVLENANSHEISLKEDGLPRRFEKLLLDQGIGARLLTRARVPIIKVCEQPTPELLQALRDERIRWDALPDDEKLDQSRPQKAANDAKPTASDEAKSTTPADSQPVAAHPMEPKLANAVEHQSERDATEGATEIRASAAGSVAPQALGEDGLAVMNDDAVKSGANGAAHDGEVKAEVVEEKPKTIKKPHRADKPWSREKKQGPLDFPKEGVGIQCDINFFNPLGLYNTHMLHCYNQCDPRVRLIILFVKAWARKRKINSPYSGTLSSYGYVLMVLHFLTNVTRPAVLPNLQTEASRRNLPTKIIDGWEVSFWGLQANMQNTDMSSWKSANQASVGHLLRDFFQYYASTSGGYGFIWMRDVLSLRTPGGIQSKEAKGWTGAKTETTDAKEVRHRYLFAIEDPFELTHNVARTVTHPGIVAIRDEFRRAWRILMVISHRGFSPEQILDDLVETVAVEPPPARSGDDQGGQSTC